MLNESLQQLVEVSARVGRNLDLVQAGGGNTSIKLADTLWVKASGKWLSRAAEEEMFLPVPLSDIERQLAAQDEKFPEYRTPSGISLRPSVETAVHAVMPQKVVIHVHSVRTIAWAAREGGAESIAPLLQGLNWKWIPYTHPGIPLAIRIQHDIASRPNVLILENHGLVVAAENCQASEALLHEVEERLTAPPRIAGPSNPFPLEIGDWEIAPDPEVHALATNSLSCDIAANGTLFPDQCVYLGPAAAVLRNGDTVNQAAGTYQARYDFAPVFLLAEGSGVLTRRGMNRAAHELLICLKRVVERIPAEARVTYLPANQVARLMNWDAEKYRIAMGVR